MSLFLLTFFLIYGGVHLYAFLKLRGTIGFGMAAGALAIFMIAMVVAPILVRLAEKQGLEDVARMLAYMGYIWMGLLFIFVSVSIAIDLYHFVLFQAEKIFQFNFTFISLPKKGAFFVSLLLSLIVTGYGYFEARNITVERIVINTPKLPQDVKKFTIVQISDVHLGLIVSQERLTRIVELVKSAHPDLLVSTGDLVDGQLNSLKGLAELLQEVNPPYGKFAITGNHEFYAGLNQALSFTEQAGFELLRGTSANVAGIVTVAGVDDPAAGWAASPSHATENDLLAGLPHDKFVLFLKHRPKVATTSLGLFDLQLSGHVHKGQIFPFALATYFFYPVRTGYSNYLRNSSLYVSRGTGTWGPPIRFLATPEVTVIELRNSNPT